MQVRPPPVQAGSLAVQVQPPVVQVRSLVMQTRSLVVQGEFSCRASAVASPVSMPNRRYRMIDACIPLRGTRHPYEPRNLSSEA